MNSRVLFIPLKGQPIPWDLDIVSAFNLKHMVGGCFITEHQPAQLKDRNIVIVTDAEAVRKGKPVNPFLEPFFYAGFAVMCGVDGNKYDGLSDDQMAYAKEWLNSLREEE